MSDLTVRMKKTITILAIATAHLLATRATIVLTEARVAANTFDDPASLLPYILVLATKVLSFPIITLSLYSRQWYPGNLIYIPFLINSLVWAVFLYFPVVWLRARRKR
jgi:hypothetical protein